MFWQATEDKIDYSDLSISRSLRCLFVYGNAWAAFDEMYDLLDFLSLLPGKGGAFFSEFTSQLFRISPAN